MLPSRENTIKKILKKEISVAQGAKIEGITRQAMYCSVAVFKARGTVAHGNIGKKHSGIKHRSKFTPFRKLIADFYRECAKIDGRPINFEFFRYVLREKKSIKISQFALRRLLLQFNFSSPKARKRYRKHKKRRERRESEGELVQFDASPFDWLGNGQMFSLHGAVDDATGKFLAGYFCENECRLGYAEVIRQIAERYGVFREAYTDRSSCFVVNFNKKNKMTLQEKIEAAKESQNWFHDVCGDLKITHIVAGTAQAKGRVEKYWQLLQSHLPFWFKYYGIKTVDQANAALPAIIKKHFSRFNVRAATHRKKWRRVDLSRIDEILAVKIEKATDKSGNFIFHGDDFALIAPRKAHQSIVLYLSERFGMKAKCADGKFYHVKILDTSLSSATMPAVEKNLIDKYMRVDMHKFLA